jgi:hypothetical protein
MKAGVTLGVIGIQLVSHSQHYSGEWKNLPVFNDEIATVPAILLHLLHRLLLLQGR